MDTFLFATGLALKNERISQCLSYRGLALKSGISRQSIKDIEVGKGFASVYTMHRLAIGLEIPFSELVSKIEKILQAA